MANSPQKVAAAKRMFEEDGASLGAIGKKYGVSRTTVSRWAQAGEWVALEDREAIAELSVSVPPDPDPIGDDEDFEVAVAPARTTVRERVDAAVSGDDRDRRIAELEAELAKYKPADVEWALDENAAAVMLADELEQMIETELEETNLERAKRGAPYITVDEMKAKRPKWYDEQVDRIIKETVDNLTRWALAEGEATRTLAMVGPDGRIKQLPLDEGIGNFGLSPREYVERLKRKGFVDTKQRKCLRQDCWLPPVAEYQAAGYAAVLGLEGFLGYCGQRHFSLDPLVSSGRLPVGAVTTATTTASFRG